mmetsp:Transcript_25089/g.50875  ORF Transcript_25089/g.50875 Transcript_25089/m.50875 type:complete len:165 (+) Transcript_25089:369-863(+)
MSFNGHCNFVCGDAKQQVWTRCCKQGHARRYATPVNFQAFHCTDNYAESSDSVEDVCLHDTCEDSLCRTAVDWSCTHRDLMLSKLWACLIAVVMVTVSMCCACNAAQCCGCCCGDCFWKEPVQPTSSGSAVAVIGQPVALTSSSSAATVIGQPVALTSSNSAAK